MGTDLSLPPGKAELTCFVEQLWNANLETELTVPPLPGVKLGRRRSIEGHCHASVFLPHQLWPGRASLAP
jgi:hypothetical protein